MGEQGRLKDAEEKFILQTLPGIDFNAEYPGTIVAQNGQQFDFQPDDPDLPGIQGLDFYTGSPGISITVDPTASPRAVLFFEGGNPGAPKLSCFGNPGLLSYQISAGEQIALAAPNVQLGSDPTDFLIKGTSYLEALATFNTGFAAFLSALGSATTFLQVNTAAATFAPILADFTTAAADSISTVSETA
jgi:hypothetical protein